MSTPSNYYFTEDHEWISVEEENVVLIGISDHAQSELGEIVYVEFPSEGDAVEKGEAFCVVESTKAASDVYAPISGTVVAVNEGLEDDPSPVNNSAFEDGWLVKLEVETFDASQYMTAEEYDAFVAA